jgi:hypothetical protein
MGVRAAAAPPCSTPPEPQMDALVAKEAEIRALKAQNAELLRQLGEARGGEVCGAVGLASLCCPELRWLMRTSCPPAYSITCGA